MKAVYNDNKHCMYPHLKVHQTIRNIKQRATILTNNDNFRTFRKSPAMLTTFIIYKKNNILLKYQQQ